MKEKIVILQNDIWKMEVDAIICHANTELEMCEAISSQLLEYGGDAIQNECNSFDQLSKGQAVITTAGQLPAQNLIHAIVHNLGEDYNDGEEEFLMKAIREAFIIIREKKLKTIALPLIGSSSLNIPVKRAAELIMAEIKKHLDGETSVENIYFVAQNYIMYDAIDEAHRQL